MNSSHYRSSFLITMVIYTIMGLVYISFNDEFIPIKEKKPEVIKISLISPIIIKKKIKKKKPKKKKIKKKKVTKKKRVTKKKIVKKIVTPPKPKPPVPKPIIEEPIIEEIIYYTPAPVYKEIIPEPIVEETPIMEEPVYYEPPPVYSEVIPQEVIQYKEPPQPTIQAPVVQAPAPPSQQRYIINEPLPIQAPPAPPVPPVKTTAVESDLSNEKRAFKEETRNIINSNKRYPTMAKRRHIQGTVHVIFDILSDGTITNIRTSGASTILQKSARKSVMNSSPLTIPSKLEHQFPMNNVSINIDFQLQ